MQIDILSLLSGFDTAGDHETETAFFRTHVPWVAPLAYLHVVFKPAPHDVLSGVARGLKMPVSLTELLRGQNGAILFSGALSIYGIHRPGQLFKREDPNFALPFNIEDENSSWPPVDRVQFLKFAGYGFDGSSVCINRNDSQIYLFQRGQRALNATPVYSWPNLNLWINTEIVRLTAIFDHTGRRLVDEAQTLPTVGPPS